MSIGSVNKFMDFFNDLGRQLDCDGQRLSGQMTYNIEYDHEGQLIIHTGIFVKAQAVEVNPEQEYVEDLIEQGDL